MGEGLTVDLSTIEKTLKDFSPFEDRARSMPRHLRQTIYAIGDGDGAGILDDIGLSPAVLRYINSNPLQRVAVMIAHPIETFERTRPYLPYVVGGAAALATISGVFVYAAKAFNQ